MGIYLVTGGAGFIGSHIVDALVNQGEKVRVLDNFSSGKKENLNQSIDKIEFIEGDIRDADTVRRAMDGVSYVSHQAALRSVPKSMTRPREYNDVNVSGFLNILIAAQEAKVKKVVWAASSSTYGDVERFPQKEEEVSFPISVYALTKKIGEDYARLFSEVYGLPVVSLRYFNVFGPRQSLEDDYAVVVPKFVTCLLKKERPPIFGDGAQSRDFTYISNVVDANLKALASPHGGGKVYNVANGETHSVLELAERIAKILEVNIAPQFLSPRAGDVRKTHADISAIKEDLQWDPQIDFESGLINTVNWFQNHTKLQ